LEIVEATPERPKSRLGEGKGKRTRPKSRLGEVIAAKRSIQRTQPSPKRDFGRFGRRSPKTRARNAPLAAPAAP
jgi:hypothetical protein